MCSAPVHPDVPAEHGGGGSARTSAKEVRAVLREGRRGKRFWKQGEPFVWATGGALALTLALSVYLMFVIMVNGLGVYWAGPIEAVQLRGDGGGKGDVLLGERVEREDDERRDQHRIKYHVGNREFGPAFRWNHLVGLARATASGFGYNVTDKPGFRAPGYEEACRLLKVKA